MDQTLKWIPYILYAAIAVTIVYLILTAVHATKLVKALAPVTKNSEQLQALSASTNAKVTKIKSGTDQMVATGKKIVPLALLLMAIRQEYNDDEEADLKTSMKRALKKKRERDEIIKLASRRIH